MKETGKITKVTIDSVPKKNFSFLGIVTSEPDYKLSHLLNKKFSLSLSHSDDEVITEPDNEQAAFSKFITQDKKYTLISNRSSQSFLLRKINKIDFLFIKAPELTAETTCGLSLQNIAGEIRKLDGITAVFIFNSNEIRDKNMEFLQNLME